MNLGDFEGQTKSCRQHGRVKLMERAKFARDQWADFFGRIAIPLSAPGRSKDLRAVLLDEKDALGKTSRHHAEVNG